MGPLILIGSAETSPGMVKVHREVMSKLPPDPQVVYIDTPHGFQENAAHITAKVQEYFDTSLSQAVHVASLLDASVASPATVEAFRLAIEGANYIFAGPGSPSYALTQWHAVDAVTSLVRASANGAAITFASAAAVTAGRLAIPVYEIYKVGTRPYWLDGLDLLANVAGIDGVVVPHWDNRDGEHHDTGHCYIGRRRLDELIEQLPGGLPIIGIDEHTAATFQDGWLTVSGRGALTVLTDGIEETVAEGNRVEAGDLFTVRPHERLPREPQIESIDLQATLAQGDGLAAADLILSRLGEDLAEDARRMIVELAETVTPGAVDPTDQIRPFVDQLIETRNRARDRGDFEEADRIRTVLIDSGVEVHDEPGRTEWTLRN
ncbi:MAG: Type 1 glutamine amidotransferase-like domain-containing protein [Acidimicrobiia bacterium]|nr:Type 1 glutamine amidotransferase-like domain-containing protein [Acidimicrobiia bacterium]